MKQKVENISCDLAKRIDRWPGVVAIVLGESGEIETLDPYFNIDIDVYHDGDTPTADERKELLGDPAGFEAALQQAVDRFFVDELPVSLTYKQTGRIEAILQRVRDGQWAFRGETTNMLYRIERGQSLAKNGPWFQGLRDGLKNTSEAFWENLKESSRLALERALSDMGAAVYREDYLFYQVAAAAFLQGLCSFLFALNCRFEPSSRLLLDHMRDLRRLPDEFSGRFESLVRSDVEITPERRYEIAELVTKSLSYL